MLKLLLLTLVFFCATVHAQQPDQRHSQSGELRLRGPVEKVFPLFTPKGELLWIPTWKYSAVYPPSGDTEENMVFRTDDGATTWTLAEYDPPRRSVYVLMNADLVARIEVACRAASPTETDMRIAYTWTALTAKGKSHFVSPEDFKAKMDRWKNWLDEYAAKAGWTK